MSRLMVFPSSWWAKFSSMEMKGDVCRSICVCMRALLGLFCVYSNILQQRTQLEWTSCETKTLIEMNRENIIMFS